MNSILRIILFIIAFSLYLNTACPTVYWGDSGELITTAYLLGIPHQPGYPLYNLLAKLFSYLPLQDIAFRCNILSCFFSAINVLLLFFIISKIVALIDSKRDYKITSFISFITSLVFLLSLTFFSHSIIQNVYPLYITFVGLLILISLTLYEKKQLKYLFLIVFIYGCASTHHLLILSFSTVILFICMVTSYKLIFKLRNIIILLLLLLLPLSIYFYLPIRAAADPIINWGQPADFERFKFTITLQQPATRIDEMPALIRQWGYEHKFHIAIIHYINMIIFLLPIYLAYLFTAKRISKLRRKIVLYIISGILLGATIFAFFFLLDLIPFYYKTVKLGFHQLIYVEYFYNQIFIIGFLLAIIGFFTLLFKHKSELLIFLSYFFILSSVFVMFHLYPANRPQLQEKFHLPAYFTLFIFIGIGISTIIYNLRKIQIVLIPLLLLYPILYFTTNYKIVNKNDYYFTYDYANNILTSCEKNSILIVNGEDTLFPLWYLQHVEGKRKDLDIIYLGGLTLKWYVDSIKEKFNLVPINIKDSRKRQKKYIDKILKEDRKIYYTGVKALPEGLIDENLLIPEGIVARIKKTGEKINIEHQIAKIKENIYKKYQYRGINDEHIDAKAKSLKSIYATMHFQLGSIYQQLNNIDATISEFNQALLLDNSYSKVHEELARIYLIKNDVKKALFYYENAVKYDSENVILRNQLGLIYYEIGKINEAINEFKTCLNIFPYYKEARYNLAMCYIALDNTDLAIKELELIIRIDNQYIDAYYQLSRIYQRLGNMVLAEYYLNKVKELERKKQ